MALKIPIYLDHHATTPVDDRVFEAMRPYFSEIFGNPSSSAHAFGWQAEAAVEVAREQVSQLIGASYPREIIWTSGTTESINMALKGLAAAFPNRNHVITTPIEHRATLETLKALEEEGLRVTVVPVDRNGLADPDDIRKAIADKTLLISLIHAHNEIGTIQPVAAVGKIAKETGILFHVDAAQACGRIPVDVEAMGIDLLSMSAHKVYGPKGIGALYIRSRNPHVSLKPLIHGGSQEQELRGGTLAVQNIVGMGKAFALAGELRNEESKRLLALRERLWQGLSSGLENSELNGHPIQRLPGNLNVSFASVPSDQLLSRLREVAVSSGSACASGSREPSYVIRALGLGDERAKTSIRFGIGRFNTEEEIDFAVEQVDEAVRKLRGLSA